MEQSVDRALSQISEKNYAQELHDQEVTNIVAYGIACKGKQILLKMQKI